MRYIPHTAEDIQEMLGAIGVSQLAELFPPSFQNDTQYAFPKALNELELLQHLGDLANKNVNTRQQLSFLGAGIYQHFIPATIDALASRGEFATAYTPYQAEISQGTLQAIYEFQSMISAVSGMAITNASMYDGASSAAEAALMAIRIAKGKKRSVVVSRTVHPEYREVIRTYLEPQNIDIHEVDLTDQGITNINKLSQLLNDQCAVVLLQYPNFFGAIEPLWEWIPQIKASGALVGIINTEAIAFGLLQSPGKLGADIFCGEGQSFGNPMSYGGPHLGLFSTKQEHLRQMPGRLVGETTDSKGNRGFVLTLSTREQHIRREKSTSNICTNQGLCALRSCIYLSLMGPKGLQHVARLNWERAHQAFDKISALPGIQSPTQQSFFNEFVVHTHKPVEEVLKAAQEQGIFAGIALKRWYPELENALLINVTEMHTVEDIHKLSEALNV